MQARVNWMGGDRFTAVADSNHAVVIDAGSGDKIASSPVELVLMALCSCTASDVVGILTKKRERFTAVEVRAEAERAPEPPKYFTSIRLVYRVRGKVARKAVEDAVRLSKEKYCSVSAMLQPKAEITTDIELDE